MKAAIYNKNEPKGVSVQTVPKTTSEQKVYQQYSHSPLNNLLIHLLYSIASCCGAILTCLRSFLPLPGKYGELKNRQLVYCRVVSGGINPVDAKNLYGDKMPHWCLFLVKWFVDERICGIDFSGVVISAPKDCRFKPGDAVYGTIPPFQGSFCEYVLAPADFISLKPKNLSFAEASVVPLIGLTTLQALHDNRLEPHHHVLVLGASGGTGHFAVQMAKAKGCRYLTAVCGSKNRQFVEQLGADKVVCYDSEETRSVGIISVLQAIVKEHGEVDIVFDSVSSHDPRDRLFSYEYQIFQAGKQESSGNSRILRKEGKYIMLGGVWQDWIKAHFIRYLGLNLFGKNRLLFWVRFPISSSYLEEITRLIEENKLKVYLTRRYPFTSIGLQTAFEDIMNRRTIGKLSIDIGTEEECSAK